MPRWERLRLATVGGLTARAVDAAPVPQEESAADPRRSDGEGAGDGLVVVRGRVGALLGAALELPIALPGAAATHAMAAASVAVEEWRRLERPLRLLVERARPFLLHGTRGRDEAGCALVRFPDLPSLELRLDRPFVQGVDGRREVYLRSVGLGDEVVVAGRLRIEVDPGGHAGARGGYRELPRIPVVEALALFDVEAWTARATWAALPLWRKLTCIFLNR